MKYTRVTPGSRKMVKSIENGHEEMLKIVEICEKNEGKNVSPGILSSRDVSADKIHVQLTTICAERPTSPEL